MTRFGKYIYMIALASLVSTGGFFEHLEDSGLEPWCEDKFVQAGVETSISCYIKNPTSQSKYFYNYGDWELKFSPDVVDGDIYVSYYGKWWYTNFTNETRLPNIPDDRLYHFVFPAYTTKYFQVRVVVNETRIIKWDFGKLDPMIISWNYIYKNKTIFYKDTHLVNDTEQIPVYKNVTQELCCTSAGNKSCNSCKVSYNSTCDKNGCYDWTHQMFDHYDYKTVTKNETYIANKTEPDTKHREGIKIGNKTINDASVNIINNTYLYECSIPVGDRNWDEYPLRQYEIDKGFCNLRNLTKVTSLEI